MMSTPTYGSSFFSRTTSGRSNQSYQTLSESLTPLSHTSYLYPSNNKQYAKPNNSFVPYGVVAKPHNGPVHAWNSTPPAHRQTNGLPPLRNSPQMYGKGTKQLNHSVPRGHFEQQPRKLSKPSYTTQFKKKQHRPPVGVTNTVNNLASSDVMKDFPMRDYALPRKNNFTVYHNSASSDLIEEENDNLSSLRNTSSVNRLPADFHVRFGKPGYFHIQNNQASGGALPEEAYKPQEISPRTSMTKELSATSLRRLNQKMRQEMEALDAEINSYQQAMNKHAKKKLTAT